MRVSSFAATLQLFATSLEAGRPRGEGRSVQDGRQCLRWLDCLCVRLDRACGSRLSGRFVLLRRRLCRGGRLHGLHVLRLGVCNGMRGRTDLARMRVVVPGWRSPRAGTHRLVPASGLRIRLCRADVVVPGVTGVTGRLARMAVFPARLVMHAAAVRARRVVCPMPRARARLRRIPHLLDVPSRNGRTGRSGSNGRRRKPHCRDQHRQRPHAAHPDHPSLSLTHRAAIIPSRNLQ